jgi:hypothetical protein
MRWLEGWLHQHIFKVGWLLTKSLHTTTILYYTFFLPGVFLHELLVWLVAGILDVRAEGAIRMPERQEIAELKLNFIKIDHKKAGAFRVAVIYLAPLVGGIVAIWFITNNILNLSGFVALVGSGDLDSVGGAVSQLLATPDFWLWVYVVFAISATMTPEPQLLRGWRLVVPPLVVILILLYAIGVGNRLVLTALESLAQGASFLIGTFAAVIGINVLMTGILGAIESVIERITGDSATFQNGKLVAMRRDEIARMRAEQAEKARRAAEAASKQTPAQRRAAAGPPSIYKLPLPIPGTPDKEGAEPITVTKESPPTFPGFDTERKSLVSPAAGLPAPAASPNIAAGSKSTASEAKPGASTPADRPPLTSPTSQPQPKPSIPAPSTSVPADAKPAAISTQTAAAATTPPKPASSPSPASTSAADVKPATSTETAAGATARPETTRSTQTLSPQRPPQSPVQRPSPLSTSSSRPPADDDALEDEEDEFDDEPEDVVERPLQVRVMSARRDDDLEDEEELDEDEEPVFDEFDDDDEEFDDEEELDEEENSL